MNKRKTTNAKVTEEMPCKHCSAWIPSDERQWVAHVVAEHDVVMGEFVHNIARMYPDFAKARPIAKEKSC